MLRKGGNVEKSFDELEMVVELKELQTRLRGIKNPDERQRTMEKIEKLIEETGYAEELGEDVD
jgi:hypothetical protein